MKILAFAASSSRKSINLQLVKYATSLLNSNNSNHHLITTLDLNDYELPLFSEDKEIKLGQPALAKDFLTKIAETDAIIISFAEHNGSYTVAYKNIFDWASRINPKVFQHKPMVLLATSPGPGGAGNVLTNAVNSAPFFHGEVQANFSLPNFFDNFDTQNQCINDETLQKQLRIAVNTLLQ